MTHLHNRQGNLASGFSMLLLWALTLFAVQVRAQVGTPTYFNATGTTSNAFPWNSTTSNKVQYIYAPNIFSTAGGGAGTPAPAAHLITKVYVKFSATVNAVNAYTNMTISMAQNLGNINNFPQAPASTGVPFYTGLTEVFYQPSGFVFTGITGNAWYGFTLNTPFAYDPSQALLVELKCSAGSGNGVATVTTAGISQRIYAGYAATTGTANTLLTPLGFDMIPAAACTAPPTPGTATTSNASPCSGVNFTLDLTGNSTGSGQTYQWQSGPTASGPWTNVGSSQSSPNFITNAGVPTYYQCEVTCSGNSQYSTPVLVNVPPPFPGGSYTIDKTQPASATNFTSFASAVAALSCGISGPITLDVVSGTGPYLEQVLLPSTIGATAINTVTFNGNGNTLTVPGTTVNLYTLGFNGADYITVNDLTIEGTDPTSALSCHLWNGADNNTFNNCTFIAPSAGTATTLCPFSISGSPTAVASTGLSGSNNVLNGCTSIGGYYSTVFYGNSTAVNTGNKAINCTAKEFYSYGIYALYQNGWEVNGCTVERPTRTAVTTTYCIYSSTGTVTSIIRNNKVRNMFGAVTGSTSSMYAIYIGTDGLSGQEHEVYNNLVYNNNSAGLQAGLYLVGADYIKAYHNTIVISDPSSTATAATYGIYSTGTVGGIDIKNNVVTLSRGGTGSKYCLYYTGGFQSSDNNVLYIYSSGGTANYIGYNGTTNFTLLTDWQTTTSKDLSSVSADPVYNNIALGDYTPTASSVSNIGANVGITTDILGAPRNTLSPDPGAYEFTLSSIDMSFQAILSPIVTTGCYGSNESVVAVIKNSGNDPMDFSLNPVTVTVNISGPSSYTVSETLNFGVLAVGATENVTLQPSIDLTVDGTYSFTGNVVASGDGNAANDNLLPFNIVVGITPGTISTIAPSNICYSETPNIILTGQYGGAIQWQMSTVSATGPWTNVGSGGTSYNPGLQTQDYWIQVESSCNGNVAASNVLAFTINNPSVATTTPASHCGAASVTLGATPTNATDDIRWYANPSGGSPLGSGITYTTPVLASTTTYYAAAVSNGAGGNQNFAIPLATGSTTGVYHHMFLATASANLTVSSIGIKCNNVIGTLTAWDIYYRPDNYQTVPGANTNSAGWTLLSSTTNVPSVGATDYTIISLPLSLTIPSGATYSFYIAPATGATHQYGTAVIGSTVASNTEIAFKAGNRGSALFNCATSGGIAIVKFNYSTGCEGSRVPVVATISAAPSITVSAVSTALCPGESTDISVTSSNDPNYDYSWTSTPSGFTATGSGPHTVSPTSVITYEVTAVDNTAGPNAGCVSTGSVTVSSAPALSGGTITANLSEHCFSGASVLTCAGSSGGPIQWEESTISSSGPWSPVGSGGTTYTTTTLTQTTYYRTSVTCGANTANSNVLTVTVNAPAVTGTTDGETCGTGPVTLSASGSTGASMIWYANPTGGTALASGTSYTTPAISSTTTYYVAASTGGGTASLGPLNPTIGAISSSTIAIATQRMFFNVLNTVTLLSVDIFPTATIGSTGSIVIRNNTQTVIATVPYTTTVTGGAMQTIPMNVILSPGTGYEMGQGTAIALNRNTTGAVYPYANANVSITGNSFDPGYYYFFYNWQLSSGCESARTPVIATVGPVVSISGLGASYATSDPAVTLSGTPSGGTFSGPGMVGNDFDPSVAGVGTHTITYALSGTSCTATQTVIVTPPPTATLNLTLYLQGYYSGSGTMQPVLSNQGLANPSTDCDDVTIELHDAASPYGLAYSFTGVLQTNGTISCTFPSGAVGNSYYIVVLQRNHVQTWSTNPVAIGSVTSYNFSTAQTQAFGDNQYEVETGVWAFYAGDVNQDLAVDGFDYIDMDPNIVNGDCGYFATDLNGDGCVDAFDFLIASPNIDNGITIQAP